MAATPRSRGLPLPGRICPHSPIFQQTTSLKTRTSAGISGYTGSDASSWMQSARTICAPGNLGLFKQIDVKRAFEAAQLAGIEVASVDIDRTGKISIVPKSKTGGDDPAPKKPRPASCNQNLGIKPCHGARAIPTCSGTLTGAAICAGLWDGQREKLSLHGLRKAAARRLAEAGCTVHEIASLIRGRAIHA